MISNEAKRDGAGLFLPGTAPGPGRPLGSLKSREFERRFLALTRECVTDDDWREIVGQAVTSAKAGCSKARDFLARYCLPPMSIIVNGVDIQPSIPQRMTREEALRLLTPDQRRQVIESSRLLRAAVRATEESEASDDCE